MSHHHETSPPVNGKSVELGIVSWWGVAAGAAKIAELRRHPGPASVALPAASLLKHADEQSVLALSAVLHAAACSSAFRQSGGFTDWAVIAAPRFLGRSTFAAAFERFQVEGAWGVSPHIVPHRSLHSPAGLLSLVLQARGPNFGVGGGPNNVAEAFLAAACLALQTPGLWLVITGWDRETLTGPFVDDASSADDGSCHAAALALVVATEAYSGPRLRIGHVSVTNCADESCMADLPALTLAGLSEMLGNHQPLPASVWSLGQTAWIEILPAGSVCAVDGPQTVVGTVANEPLENAA